MALFYPTLYRRRVTDITVADLQRLGAQGLLLDVDNTLTTHDNPDLTAEVAAWLAAMRAAGLPLIIVSNNNPARVAPFAGAIGLPFQALARKPLPGGYRAAASQMGIEPHRCVAIGDQIFTDIVGANLAGMPCILLEPIAPEVGQPFIRFKRMFERWLLACPRQRKRREADYRG